MGCWIFFSTAGRLFACFLWIRLQANDVVERLGECAQKLITDHVASRMGQGRETGRSRRLSRIGFDAFSPLFKHCASF
jgi:hypothetical protein